MLGGEVEADRRLVEHQQPLARGQRLREHHAPLLAARERADQAIAAIGDADARERVVDGAAIGGARPAQETEVREPSQHDDVAHTRRKARRDRVTLRHVADLARLIGRRTLLDQALDALVAEKQRLVRRILTRHLMSIDLGTAVRLQLGEDLGAGFPPSLREIIVPELRDLLDRIDPTHNSQRDSGAVDWADLDDRVHFIADMFRCFQESPFLFDPPFDQVQVERLEAGERPTDPL